MAGEYRSGKQKGGIRGRRSGKRMVTPIHRKRGMNKYQGGSPGVGGGGKWMAGKKCRRGVGEEEN